METIPSIEAAIPPCHYFREASVDHSGMHIGIGDGVQRCKRLAPYWDRAFESGS